MKNFFKKLWNDENTFSRIMKIVVAAGFAVGTAFAGGVPITPELVIGVLGSSTVLGSVGSNGKAVK